MMTAHRAAWELANGALPAGARVAACPASRACVRLDHLRVVGRRSTTAAPEKRSAKGSGSKVEVRPGVWKLTVNNRRYTDGSVRRVHRTVHVEGSAAATRELAKLVAEVAGTKQAASKQLRDITLDEAIERFVIEHLLGEKGRAERTADLYRRLHAKWFSPELGHRRVRDVDEAGIDKAFGRMRRAGLSRSRLNHAKSLYSPFFRWAKRRQIITRNPMAEFQLPTSRQVSLERTPPEVEQLCLLLATAVEVVPEVAPILALGAVTGMRRGELVGLRRSRVLPDELRITVDSAVAGPGRLKATKTRRERSLFIDRETMTMLETHCAEMDARAASFGVEVAADGFVFSHAPDCSTPVPADYVTKRVAVLKERLGIADKRPETIVLEDEALRLFRQPRAARPAGRTGPLRPGL